MAWASCFFVFLNMVLIVFFNIGELSVSQVSQLRLDSSTQLWRRMIIPIVVQIDVIPAPYRVPSVT